MNACLRWYRRVVLFGIGANLSFAFTALYAPGRLLRILGLRQIGATIWLRNVGMLLVLVSMFNAGSALAPRRFPLYSWFVPIARLIAATFFLRVAVANPHRSSERPRVFLLLFLFDFTMGVVCSALLGLGLSRAQRLKGKGIRRLLSGG